MAGIIKTSINLSLIPKDKIIIGKKGEMLKKIGTGARKKIQSLLGNKVFLKLHVKVLKQWTHNELHLKSLGFD